MKFGEKVRELRTKKNITQAELAKLVGVAKRQGV
jgi:transcriptional regulator with XRE-family HTH domain